MGDLEIDPLKLGGPGKEILEVTSKAIRVCNLTSVDVGGYGDVYLAGFVI